jgi:hypothetical protein
MDSSVVPRACLAAFGVALALLTANAVRTGRMIGAPPVTRDKSPRAFWLLLAARGALVALLVLSAAAPDLMMDIVNGAND